MSGNFEQLRAHILGLSKSSRFDSALLEWDFVHIELHDEFGNCPCGQEIREHCYIRNRVTGHSTHVGNVCVKRFMGVDNDLIFSGLKRIKANEDAAPNEALLKYAYFQGILNKKEVLFLLQTQKKRKLSAKQLAWRTRLNQRLLLRTVVTPDPSQQRSAL